MAAESAPLLGEELQGLDDISVRHGFIQKVYGILGCQLTLTTIVGGIVMHYGEIWAKSNPAMVMTMLWGSLAVSVAMLFVFICCPDTMRQTPTNYIILTLFTLAESVMVGFICIQYTQESVLIALGLTAFIVCSLTLFACQTSYDFTGMGPYLFVACMVLMGFGFVLSLAAMFGSVGPAWHGMRLCYSAAGALLFSMYIVYDTQLIVGGKHSRCQFSIDDYAMAAISLYIDIVQLFLYLLQLFGDRR